MYFIGWSKIFFFGGQYFFLNYLVKLYFKLNWEFQIQLAKTFSWFQKTIKIEFVSEKKI